MKLNIKQAGIIVGGLALICIAYLEFFAADTTENVEENQSATIPVVSTDSADIVDHTKSEVYESKTNQEMNSTKLTYDEIYALAKQKKEAESQEAIEVLEEDPAPKVERKVVYVREKKQPVVKKVEPVAVVKERRRGGFYGSDQKVETKPIASEEKATKNFIAAVVHGDHDIRTGQRVVIRVIEDCVIKGTKIPKNTYITGTASLSGERAKVSITNIKLPNQIVTANVTVYDFDGVEGIYNPGGLEQELRKEALDESLEEGATINVPVIGSFSTNALKKKTADLSMEIDSGYNIYLKEILF